MHRLLSMELSTYLPRRLLFLTGLDWAKEFLEEIAPEFTVVPNNEYVKAIGELANSAGTTKIVVAVHPQDKRKGKDEKTWGKASYDRVSIE